MNKLSKTFDIERLKTKLNFCAKEARDISDRLLFVETKDIDLAHAQQIKGIRNDLRDLIDFMEEK